MFCAIVRYSVCVSVPSTMVSVPVVVGCVTSVSVVLVMSLLLIFRITVASNCRNCAWLILVPFTVISVGSVL